MNPPPGCPFQTRCPRKIGAICETELPPVKQLAPGHSIMCHLSDDVLRAMEPVIQLARAKGGERGAARGAPDGRMVRKATPKKAGAAKRRPGKRAKARPGQR
jgi:peptide/nickel transport system ATP-binding protein